MTMTTLPAPAEVAARANDILDALKAHPDYERLGDSARRYTDCWATFTGYPIIASWNLDTDTGPLFDEAMRVLALKSAVFELTDGDEHAAELVVSAPVDEMVHAVLAQYTLCQRMTAALGIRFVHMTDQERFGWNPGDYTHRCYLAAGWGEPNPRYWIDAATTRSRLQILNQRYATVGIGRDGRSHSIDFTGEAARLVLAG
ncbi:hypothetical protein [Virgisporangium aliadipatigenens]|nr:hypothetical protein [Virgisporangium aliadipatigenens]